MAARRPSGMGGISPISYTEVEAWARLTQRTPAAYEIEGVMALDDAFLNVVHADDRKRRETPPASPLR